MSATPEEQLDLAIDALNEEREPGAGSEGELADLIVLARALRSLRPTAHPRPEFRPEGLLDRRKRRSRHPWLRRMLFPAAALFLMGCFILFAVIWPGPAEPHWVQAMEQAVQALDGYHGILEKRVLNANGEEWLQQRLEIWAQGETYAVRDDQGTWTVNDGNRRWQIRPQDRTVAILPLLPDFRAFDLTDEARRARRYPHHVVGRETVAGREAIRIQIHPPGGLPYDLWIDARTHMPLQLRSAMQNALQSIDTFVQFEANPEMDPQIFQFDPPAGYRIIAEDPGERVHSPHEAAAITGFVPPLPSQPPSRILAHKDRIVLDYGDTVVLVSEARGPFQPARHGALGQAGGGPLEILDQRLRWRQGDLEILVEGPRALELAREIAPDLQLPADRPEDTTLQAQVRVHVDLEQVRAAQQQVDAGSSPWQLDPVQVALTFVNLQVTPEGIQGEPEIPYHALEVVHHTGREAQVDVDTGPIRRVYLQRLVRQDETGIWTVVGYDPREEP